MRKLGTTMPETTGLIINDDCSVALKSIATESIDMVLTSPPYDDLRRYNGFNFNEGVFRTVAKELARVLKQGGVLVWVVSDAIQNGTITLTAEKQFIYFVERCKLNLHAPMIFVKQNPMPSNFRRPMRSWEYMYAFSKGNPKTYHEISVATKYAGCKTEYGKRNGCENAAIHKRDSDIRVIKPTKPHTDVFTYAVGGTRTGHPAVFPEQLAIDQIGMWTNEYDVVLDPFSGASTTGIACKQLNRNYIGIEISTQYANVAKQRIETYVGRVCK